MCIKRDENPYTFLCGIPLIAGVVLVGAIDMSALIYSIVIKETIGVVTSLFFLLPILVLMAFRKSLLVTTINLGFQWLKALASFVCLLVFVWAIDGMDLPSEHCADESHDIAVGKDESEYDECLHFTRVWMYNGWAIAICILAPYHYAFISVFQAYRLEIIESPDEIDSDVAQKHTLESTYQKLPQHDRWYNNNPLENTQNTVTRLL